MTTEREARAWLPVIAALLALILAGVAFIAGRASAATGPTGPRYIMERHQYGPKGTMEVMVILDQETDELLWWEMEGRMHASPRAVPLRGKPLSRPENQEQE